MDQGAQLIGYIAQTSLAALVNFQRITGVSLIYFSPLTLRESPVTADLIENPC
jgi:hypothetical protein